MAFLVLSLTSVPLPLPISPNSMDPISLLSRQSPAEFTPEEDAALARELSAAYHMDESAAASRDVQRIGEKVRARIRELAKEATHDSSNADHS